MNAEETGAAGRPGDRSQEARGERPRCRATDAILAGAIEQLEFVESAQSQGAQGILWEIRASLEEGSLRELAELILARAEAKGKGPDHG